MHPQWPSSGDATPSPSDPWKPPGHPTAGPGYGGYGDGGYAPPTRTEPLAIVSLVAGVAQFVMPVIAGIVAVVTGHLARANIRRAEGRLQGGGLALAGLILGYIGLAFTVLAVAGLITVVAVFHDDWARTDARHQARRFADALVVESSRLQAGPRDANVIARAWGEACDCRGGDVKADVSLAGGGDVFTATDAEWARYGWRMQFVVHDIGDGRACLTIPAEIGSAPVITGGRCDTSAAT